jgi:hypothetical protein
MKRAFFDIILCIGLFALPWYATAILAIIGMFLFDRFYEYLGIAVFVYALYGVEGLGWFSDPLWYSVSVLALYLGLQELRRSIIFYTS